MTEPYNWSPAMAAIRKECVLDPIAKDPRTNRAENLVLGYPVPRIRTGVLEWGLADFRTPADLSGRPPLSPEDKVVLDCYVNMRKHFFACTVAYEAYRPKIEVVLGGNDPVVVDVGCGPATAGLALADKFPGRTFDYVGIDTATAMMDKADEHWEAAKRHGLVGGDSQAVFQRSWDLFDVRTIAPERAVLVLFSYFFASRSLNPGAIRSLVEFVRSLAAGRTTDLTVVYVNAPQEQSATNYNSFVRSLGFDPVVFPPSPMTVEFRTLGGEQPGKEEFVYDLFHLLGD